MKILNAQQIRDVDAHTIANEPIDSIDLMERAAMACTDEISSMFDKTKLFFVFCGQGNNGGDGLAISRQLYERGYDVKVFLADFSSNESEGYLINKKKLKNYGIDVIRLSEKGLPFIKGNSVIIDAVFGIGLNREVQGEYAKTIHHLNLVSEKGIPVVSIDLPSGLFDEDNSSNNTHNIIRASITLTFQVPKLAFMFSENSVYVGKWKVLNIGLDEGYIEKLSSPYNYIDFKTAASLYKRRDVFSHKGIFGHALLIAGSYGKMGAAVLAAKACLRSGTGLLTTHIPGSGYSILQTTVPESMVHSDINEKTISECFAIEKYTAIGAGPGIGTEKITAVVIKALLQNSTSPLVLDADALNILSENKTWLSFLPPSTILTPHLKEFERLAGKTSNSFQRLALVREFAKKNNLVLVLKGANTAIAFADGTVWFNSTGNPGMATAGSGDVLTGILTGLIAQGYGVLQASIFGVYLHGLSGDFAKEELGEDALIASDIIKYLPKAFLALSSYKPAV
ncbi:MAG: NAD(P)H-hydrate dehydratase [Bacteroidetes bacterium]|nr:NAD(P)H-hydrate dehydratase [Bacteroidota bacterium]HET6245030.1 NAD(P)H-hydrate dehydratase [Bacteroidia bacterium]